MISTISCKNYNTISSSAQSIISYIIITYSSLISSTGSLILFIKCGFLEGVGLCSSGICYKFSKSEQFVFLINSNII